MFPNAVYNVTSLVDETCEIVPPIKLWLKIKVISYYDDTDLNQKRHIVLDATLHKELKWHY